MISRASLEADRLVLREFEDADWVSVHGYASDSEVVRYMDWGPNSEEDTRNFIQRAIAYQREDPRRHFELAVVLKADGQLIGGCGIHIITPSHREGEIGYCFSRHHWGHGYASEAARALLTLGFEQLGLHRIFATCDTDNLASARVLEKIGMRREGRLREDTWQRGRWRDSFLYAILDHEWDRVKAGRSSAT